MQAMSPVYLDYAASTPVDLRVQESMMPFLTVDQGFANPASRSHVYGWQVEQAVEQARVQVARLLCCDPLELYWTSGATEANNLALKGLLLYQRSPVHFITSKVEHKAILDTAAFLQQQGVEVTYLKPMSNGMIDPDSVQAAFRPHTRLVSLMQVNNELGVINDIAVIGRLCRERGVCLHVDAAQSVGKLECSALDLSQLCVDMMSFSAHKCYGPKGVGALFVRRASGLELTPLLHGGGQERGVRPGTVPTHQVIGMGKAFALVQAQQAKELAEYIQLRERLLAGLSEIACVNLHTDVDHSVANIVNIGVRCKLSGEALLLALDSMAVSSGSACNTVALEPSYVLLACGVARSLADTSLRISFGRFTRAEEIDLVLEQLRSKLV